MRYSVISRRATAHDPPGSGSPGASPTSSWESASRCHGSLIDAPRPDLDAAGQPYARELGHSLEHRGPHVQLDLLAHPQAVVQQVREPVARPCPRLDAELEEPIAPRGEVDLPGLEVAIERGEAERRRRAVDDTHRAVPRAGHPHDVLVTDPHPALIAEQLVEARELARRHPVRIGSDRPDQVLRGD